VMFQSAMGAMDGESCDESDGWLDYGDEDLGWGDAAKTMMCEAPASFGGPPPPPVARGMRSRRGICSPPRPKVGRANAARVSRGSMADRVNKTVDVAQPKRDGAQHITVTVVIYNTVAGGVPSEEDVKAAVDDMESLYTACGWQGRLADAGADFMKAELTVENMVDIAGKLISQPYKPPTGAVGLVAGGDMFPTSAA